MAHRTAKRPNRLSKLFEHNVTAGSFTKHYLFGGKITAVREGLNASSSVSFFATDHLGSVTATMWANGSPRSQLRYDPWGKERYAQYATPTGYRYTGQRWDSGLGLYDYNARYYDPAIGKFISADTLVPEQKRLTPLTVAFHENQFLEKVNQENGQIAQFGPINSWNAQQKKEFGVSDGPLTPQNLNRLAYAANNPLRYLDPTGHYLIDHIDIDLTAQEVQYLIAELDWWIDNLGHFEDATTYASMAGAGMEVLVALGALATNPLTVGGGVLLAVAGPTVDWTNDDLNSLRLALEIESYGGMAGVQIKMGSDGYHWGIEVNDVEAVGHSAGSPKAALNGTQSFMMMWYWFAYSTY